MIQKYVEVTQKNMIHSKKNFNNIRDIFFTSTIRIIVNYIKICEKTCYFDNMYKFFVYTYILFFIYRISIHVFFRKMPCYKYRNNLLFFKFMDSYKNINTVNLFYFFTNEKIYKYKHQLYMNTILMRFL